MKFFSKIVFICNLCFIAAVILRYWENAHKKDIRFDGALPLQPLQSTLVVLGYGAVVINLFFNLFIGFFILRKMKHGVPKWIIWFNFLLLLVQVWYFDLLFIS